MCLKLCLGSLIFLVLVQKRQKVNQRRHTWVPTTKKEWASKNGGCGMCGIIFGDSLATRLYFRFVRAVMCGRNGVAPNLLFLRCFPIAPPFRNSDEKSKNQWDFFCYLVLRNWQNHDSSIPTKNSPLPLFSSGSRNIRSLRLGCFMALQLGKQKKRTFSHADITPFFSLFPSLHLIAKSTGFAAKNIFDFSLFMFKVFFIWEN